MADETQQLPTGLELHCAECGIVIPADAPRSGAFDCAHIAKNKLAHFRATDPRTGQPETPAAQHVMAVAAWAMIYDAALRAEDPDAVAYQNQFRVNRKAHFQASATYKALTEDDVKVAKLHPRDGALY